HYTRGEAESALPSPQGEDSVGTRGQDRIQGVVSRSVDEVKIPEEDAKARETEDLRNVCVGLDDVDSEASDEVELDSGGTIPLQWRSAVRRAVYGLLLAEAEDE
ncbi:hypothetical protein JG688_00018258, partial [Phytophthora aleatoria]